MEILKLSTGMSKLYFSKLELHFTMVNHFILFYFHWYIYIYFCVFFWCFTFNFYFFILLCCNNVRLKWYYFPTILYYCYGLKRFPPFCPSRATVGWSQNPRWRSPCGLTSNISSDSFRNLILLKGYSAPEPVREPRYVKTCC